MNFIHLFNKNNFLLLFIIFLNTSLLFAQEKTENKATIKIMKEIDGKMTAIDTTIQMTGDMDINSILKELGVEKELNIDLKNMDEEVKIIKKEAQEDADSTKSKTTSIKIMKSKDGKMTAIDSTLNVNDEAELKALLEKLGIENKIDISLKDTQNGSSQHIDIDLKSEDGKEKKVKKMIFIEKTDDTNIEEKKPFLGVFLANKIDENGKEMGFETDKGILVEDIVEKSAAEEAGLKGGDFITHIDGKVVKTEDELVAIIGEKKVGDEVKITYLRGKKSKMGTAILTAYEPENIEIEQILENHVTLGKDEESTDNEPIIVEKKYETTVLLGIFVEELEDAEGVKVATVWDTTPAFKAGLEKDDIVTHIDGKAINSHNDLMRVLSQYSAGNNIEITYKRGDKTTKTKATLKAKESSSGFKWKGIFGR